MFRYGGGGFCNGWMFGNTPYGGMIMMGIGLILLLVLGFFIYKYASSGRIGSGESALDTLQKRYVNGEISKEEYEEMRKTLKG